MTDDLGVRGILWKGWLFFALGVLSSGALLALHPEPVVLALLAVAAWSFCRWYFFMFYVVEKWVDPGFRFDGLWSFLRWMRVRR